MSAPSFFLLFVVGKLTASLNRSLILRDHKKRGGVKRVALIGCHSRNFCTQNDVFVGVRVGFVLRLTLDKQIGMCPQKTLQIWDAC